MRNVDDDDDDEEKNYIFREYSVGYSVEFSLLCDGKKREREDDDEEQNIYFLFHFFVTKR